MRKNGFFTFCFSFVPGAGQMYQGYMKRGVSIMTLFILFIALGAVTAMGVFALPSIVIYAYSFFDTWNIRNKREGDMEPTNEYIWENTEIKKVLDKFKINKQHKVLGMVLIVLGAYILMDTVLRRLAYAYDFMFLYRLINTIMSYLPPIIISAVSIGLGIKFISKK